MNAREVLFRLVAGDAVVARAAAEIASDRGWWEAIVQTAHRWKVLPELNRSLQTLGILVGDPARTTIRKLSRESFLRSSIVAARGSNALGKLERAGISAIAFKGLAVVAVASAPRGDRTLQDVDIMVKRDDLEAVLTTLEKHGYQRGFHGEIGEYLTFVQNSPGFSGNEALNLRSADGGELDVHWRAGPRRSTRFDARSLLSRARGADLRGRRILVPCSVDAALLTIHHSVRNNLTPDEVTRDLMDLEVWIRMLDSDGETRSFVIAVSESAMEAPALALIEILHRVQPGSHVDRARTEIASAMSASGLRSARRMVELFDAQLRDGPVNPDMLYLLHGGPIKSIISGALGGWSRYREQMAVFEMRKHGAKVSISRRMGLLLDSLVRSRAQNWQGLLALSKAKMS